MLHTIELRVDSCDYQAIQEAMSRRQAWRVLPDSDESTANLSGRLVAEICRGWMEGRDTRVIGDLDDDGEGWKYGPADDDRTT